MFLGTAKRNGYIIASSLAILTFIIMSTTRDNSPNMAEETIQEELAGARAAVQNFWIAYREATRQRIAGRPQQAVESYRRALELQSHHEDALYYLGNMYVDLGRFAAADSAWRRLIEVNSRSSRAWMQLGNLYSTPELLPLFDLTAAESDFRQALDINSEESGPYLGLAKVALMRGDLSAAQRHFFAVISSNFRSVEAHYLTGYISWKTGHPQIGEERLSQAIKYARPRKVTGAISGEGDTRTGRPLGTATTLGMGAFIQAQLSDLSAIDTSRMRREMNTRYVALETFLSTMPAGAAIR